MKLIWDTVHVTFLKNTWSASEGIKKKNDPHQGNKMSSNANDDYSLLVKEN